MKHSFIKLIILFITIGMSTSIMAQMSLEYNTNLSDGTTIHLTMNGTVNVTVDWGDGNSESFSTAGARLHEYLTEGIYTVTISGTLTQFGDGDYYIYPTKYKKLVKVNSFGDIGLTSLGGAFYKEPFLQEVSTDLPSTITDLSYAFKYTNKDVITGLDSWNVSNVTNMCCMFNRAYSFNQDISSWNVGNVETMRFMFAESSFNQNIGGWNVSSVSTMEWIFSETPFNQDISSWDVSNVTVFSGMFLGADAFNQDIGNWVFSSAATNMKSMFLRASSFDQDISSWDVSNVTDMAGMFLLTDFNQDISGWSTGNVSDMSRLFKSNTSFSQDISSWDVSSVTNMSEMFYEATAFNQDISSWTVSSVTDMHDMFNGATIFNQDLSSWNISLVQDLERMFSQASLSSTNYSNMLIAWASLNLYNNARFDAGLAQYSTGVAADARAAIILDDNWTINDGGVVGSYIWNGTAKSSSWNVAANWSDNTVPTATDHVVIPKLFGGSDVYISSDNTGDCANLQVNNDGILNIESGASLINSGTITNNGTINVKRTIPDGEWHFIAVPNNVSTANIFIGDYLQTWNETNGSWSDIIDENTALVKGKGYSLRGVAKSTYTFEGTPNTGDVSTAITYTDNGGLGFDGANFLGNPYTSSIDWDDLNETYGAVYVWNSSTQDYEEWNGSGSNGVQYIPPMQGFFIVTNESSPATFDLTNSMRTHTGANEYYKSLDINNGVVLVASNASFEDQLFIRFDDASSADFELQNDAYKFLSNTDGVSQLYSFADEKKFSIDIRPETDVIQLGFQNNQSGNYQIGLSDIDLISSVILEDTKTETLHNLIDSDYEFEWNTTDSEKRFKLHMKATGIDDISTQDIQLYAHQKTIYIQSNESLNNAQILVVDMMGRVVYENNLADGKNEAITLIVSDGVYITNLISDSGVYTKKVILK